MCSTSDIVTAVGTSIPHGHPTARHPLHELARICEFFFGGVKELHLPWAVKTLPALLHLSLFLFFCGLLVFLFNIHHTVFSFVASWIGLSVLVYGYVTQGQSSGPIAPIICLYLRQPWSFILAESSDAQLYHRFSLY